NPHSMKIKRRKKQIIFPGFKRNFTVNYQLKQLPRGEHQLSNIRIRTGDVFGLIQKEHVFQTSDYMMVYQSRHSIHMDEQSQSLDNGTMTAHSHNISHSNVVSGIREYLPGDRFSWIDWKQTARKNTMRT